MIFLFTANCARSVRMTVPFSGSGCRVRTVAQLLCDRARSVHLRTIHSSDGRRARQRALTYSSRRMIHRQPANRCDIVTICLTWSGNLFPAPAALIIYKSHRRLYFPMHSIFGASIIQHSGTVTSSLILILSSYTALAS